MDASLAKLFEARRRRDMYLGFAEDPVAFLNTIIASQVRRVEMCSCVDVLPVSCRMACMWRRNILWASHDMHHCRGATVVSSVC